MSITEKKHPIQPLSLDEHGVLRFKENKIITWLFESGKLNLTEIMLKEFPQEDLEQLHQLLGSSLSHFGDLDHVSNETYDAADKLSKESVSELEARNEALREELEELKGRVKKFFNEALELDLVDLVDL